MAEVRDLNNTCIPYKGIIIHQIIWLPYISKIDFLGLLRLGEVELSHNIDLSVYISNKMGGLNPRLSPGCLGNSKVKPPKVGIILGWVTFVAVYFPLHPTIYDPPNHSGHICVFNHVGTSKLALGRGSLMMLANLSMLVQGIHLWRKAVVFGSSLGLLSSIT
jgi:hypothetical protein